MVFVDNNNIRIATILLLIHVYMISSQELQSPCPNVFEYRNDGGVIYGFIQIRPMGSVPAILTKINFTIAIALPSVSIYCLVFSTYLVIFSTET